LADGLPVISQSDKFFMKRLLAFGVASLISVAAFAQTTKFGLKAGVNLPKYQFTETGTTIPDSRSTTNFHITGYADAPLGSYVSIQPGVSLQGKGGKFDVGGSTYEQNTLWAEIPVNIVAKFPLGTGIGHKFFLGAGPYAAFAISGENKFTSGSTTVKNDVQFGNESGDDIKGVDFGANFIGGFEMASGFTLGAGYGLGISDLRPNGSGGSGKQTNRVWSFSAGFLF
jgi:hypothetical protein